MVPPQATISGAIVATNAGSTPAGLLMALAYEHVPGRYKTAVALGTLESAVGALRTYHEGRHCGDGIHHLYAWTLGVERLAPKAAINSVVTPSHRVTAINVQVHAATMEEPRAELTWMLRRPYARLPPVKYTALPAGPDQPTRVVAGAGGNPRSGALQAPMGTELPARPRSALGLVHE